MKRLTIPSSLPMSSARPFRIVRTPLRGFFSSDEVCKGYDEEAVLAKDDVIIIRGRERILGYRHA